LTERQVTRAIGRALVRPFAGLLDQVAVGDEAPDDAGIVGQAERSGVTHPRVNGAARRGFSLDAISLLTGSVRAASNVTETNSERVVTFSYTAPPVDD
jgi:hypothetical protein